MYKQLLPVVICLALLLVPIVYSEEQKPVIRPDIKGLYSKEPLIRQGTHWYLVEQRNNDIKSLIAIVEDKTAPKFFRGTLHFAVLLLGEYRAVEAVDALIANILYVPAPYSGGGPMEWEGYYACAMALRDIGSPCLEKIFLRMPKAEKKERQILAWVVKEILGKELAIAALQLEAIKPFKDAAAVVAYVEAMRYIKDWKPIFEVPPEARVKPPGFDENP